MNVLTSATSTQYPGWNTSTLQIVAAQPSDSDTVVALFGALHSYNASLDAHFALADDWETLLRQEFAETCQRSDKLWLLVKDGCKAVGLLIAGIHTDSPMFKHRQWVEVEALYVADSHRCMGLAHALLNRAYTWAEINGMARVQLYVTASNERAQSVYGEQGFSVTQAIMRKSL
jgi:ribosomal protein S18 acetylase RimI-like enzyme